MENNNNNNGQGENQDHEEENNPLIPLGQGENQDHEEENNPLIPLHIDIDLDNNNVFAIAFDVVLNNLNNDGVIDMVHPNIGLLMEADQVVPPEEEVPLLNDVDFYDHYHDLEHPHVANLIEINNLVYDVHINDVGEIMPPPNGNQDVNLDLLQNWEEADWDNSSQGEESEGGITSEIYEESYTESDKDSKEERAEDMENAEGNISEKEEPEEALNELINDEEPPQEVFELYDPEFTVTVLCLILLTMAVYFYWVAKYYVALLIVFLFLISA